MKKHAIVILIFIMAFCFFACAQSNSTAQVPNPIVNVSSAENFTEIGIILNVPKSATNVTYNIVANTVAEIYFTLDENEFTLRASKFNEGVELHGIYEEFDEEAMGTEIDADNYSISEYVNTIKGGKGALATAKINVINKDALNVTLFTNAQLKLSEISAVMNEIYPFIVGDISEGANVTEVAKENDEDVEIESEKIEINSEINWQSDTHYAVALIGGYYDNMQDVMVEPKEKYVPNIQNSHEFGSEGNEKYLIVPRHTDTYIEVFEIELSEDGQVVKKNETPSLTTEKGSVLWLTCNMSDLYPDVLLVLKNDEGLIAEVSPFISLKDGEIVITEEGQILQ